MGNKIHLRIVAPTRTMHDGECDMVIMRTTEGDIGVLAGHQPLNTILTFGKLRVINDGETRDAAVMGGFVEVSQSGITIVTQIAEWADEIDIERAKEAKARAEASLNHEDKAVVERAMFALRRANVRLETSSFAIIKGRT